MSYKSTTSYLTAHLDKESHASAKHDCTKEVKEKNLIENIIRF